MSIRVGTVYYENFEGHDLNYYKHEDEYCVYIGDVLAILEKTTKRGNYAEIAHRFLVQDTEYLVFKLNDDSWNRVYLTAAGVFKLFESFKSLDSEVSKYTSVICHCVNTINDLYDGRKSLEEKPRREKKSVPIDSYAIDLLEDIDRRLSKLEAMQDYIMKGIQRDMLLVASHDLQMTENNVMIRSILAGTLMCLVDCQIQNPLSKNKDLKERLKRAYAMLSKEFKHLDGEDEYIQERKKQIEDYKRAIKYSGDGLEEEFEETDEETEGA